MKGALMFQRGGAALKLIVIIPAVMFVAGIGWFTYAELRLRYWDDKVRELCAEEGGITVFERVALRDHRYLDSEMNIRIPAKLEHLPGYGAQDFEAKPDDLFFRRLVTTIIRAESPRVARDDIFVIRSSDMKVLGQATLFARVGGDLFAIDFESRFRCPDDASESHLTKKIFLIETKAGAKQ